MSEIVRRSKLIVSLNKKESMEKALESGADTIVLDLATMPESGPSPGDVVPMFDKSGADIFVLINHDNIYPELEKSVCPGIEGIVYPAAESAKEIINLDKLIGEAEKQRDIPLGTLQIDVIVHTARGIWNVFEIVSASPRVISISLDLVRLVKDLKIEPTEEVDQFAYARGRVVVAARSREDMGSIVTPPGKPLVGIQPHGLPFLNSLYGNLNDEGEWIEAAKKGYIFGFRGSFCKDLDQVKCFNKGFSPPEDDVHHAKEVIEKAEAGYAGRDISAPMIEEARALLSRCETIENKEKLKTGASLPI